MSDINDVEQHLLGGIHTHICDGSKYSVTRCVSDKWHIASDK